MPKTNTYNGYTNYETWNCALWLNNDQGTNEMIVEKAEELVNDMENPRDKDEACGITSLLADFISSVVDEMQEVSALPTSGMFADLLQSALREIDYYDIAESQLADALRARQEAGPKRITP